MPLHKVSPRRRKFNTRIDDQAADIVRTILLDREPDKARTYLKAFLRQVAIDAARHPEMFTPDELGATHERANERR